MRQADFNTMDSYNGLELNVSHKSLYENIEKAVSEKGYANLFCNMDLDHDQRNNAQHLAVALQLLEHDMIRLVYHSEKGVSHYVCNDLDINKATFSANSTLLDYLYIDKPKHLHKKDYSWQIAQRLKGIMKDLKHKHRMSLAALISKMKLVDGIYKCQESQMRLAVAANVTQSTFIKHAYEFVAMGILSIEKSECNKKPFTYVLQVNP
jgi:hypothetical protein